MKNIFRQLLPLTTIGAFTFGMASSHAQAQSVPDSSPVMIGSGCNYQIRMPDRAMGYIPSADCKTIYVLPSAIGDLKIPSFMPTAHTLLCDALNSYQENRTESFRAITQLNKSLKTAATEKERRDIQAKIDAISRYSNQMSEVFANKDAAYAQLVFANTVDAQTLDQWALNNLEVIRSQGVAFRGAPVGTSVLTFSTLQSASFSEPAILQTSIPGLTKQNDGSFRTVLFNGALSGQVVLSVYGACGMLNKVPHNVADLSSIKPDLKNISASLIANQSYEVPTRAKMRYTATLKKTDAIRFMNKFYKERANAFTVSELVHNAGDGHIEDLVDLQLEVSELSPAQLDNWNSFKANFYQDVMTRLFTRMANELSNLKLLEITPRTPEDAPQAGVVYEPGTKRVCSSSSFLGITIGGSCHDVAISIPVQTGGKSSLIDEQALNLGVNIEESMTINEPFNYSFTSAFMPASN